MKGKHDIQTDNKLQEESVTEQQVGYPDISRANTKTVVIISLICILLIFFLSIFIPEPSNDGEASSQSETTGSTTEITTEAPAVEESSQNLFDMGSTQTSATTEVFSMQTFSEPETGFATSRQGLSALKAELISMTENYSGSWSIYVKDIDNNEYLTINNVQRYSASLIKLYCAATAYDLMDKGKLEQTETIERLMEEMISISDNDAFNLMVMNCAEDNSHVTGRGVIQDYIDKNGYANTTITSILVPTRYKAPSSPGRNSTSVADCGLLLEKIYKGKCVSPEASEQFLDLLLNQTHVNKIPAGLPEGTKCANKTGETDEYQHDAAIVYSPGGDYILCIMSSNCGAAITNIQDISATVYDYFN